MGSLGLHALSETFKANLLDQHDGPQTRPRQLLPSLAPFPNPQKWFLGHHSCQCGVTFQC